MKFLSYLWLVLAATLIFLSITGCQPQTSHQSPAASSPPNPLTPTPVVNQEILAFAGSSAKAALDAAGSAFQTKTGIKVNLTYGGSGTLLSQLELARTGDLYIPASPDYIEKAAKDNVIHPETENRLYYLIPAILVQKGNPLKITTLADLAKPGVKVAMCDPKSVPAGLFAYEVLDFNKMTASVGSNVVVYADSNEKVSSYVILKSVDAAIAWDNAAIQQPDKLDVIYLQPDQVPRLSYMSGAVTTFTKDKDRAQGFLQYLVSAEGQQIFKKFGYYTTEEEVKKLAPQSQVGGIYNLPSDYTPLVR